MNEVPASTPDFLVQWGDTTDANISAIHCMGPVRQKYDLVSKPSQKPLSILHTPATGIAVANLVWNSPTTITLTPNRPGFCLALSKSSSMPISYGYLNEPAQSAEAGKIALLLPGKTIRSQLGAGSISAIMCSFETAYAESILGPLSALSAAQTQAALDIRNALISSLLMRLMQEALYPGPLCETIAQTYGQALLLECAHWLLATDNKTQDTGKLTARHFAIIEEYLTSWSGSLPRVADLAKACGFSERYFARLFRDQTDCTVAQYIKSVQISKAKTLLLETELPLKEIAFRLGFSSPANFSSAFSSATGSSPGEFRRA